MSEAPAVIMKRLALAKSPTRTTIPRLPNASQTRREKSPAMGGTSPDTEQFGQHPFGLTSQEETRAARLHTESIIVDMLFQGPCGFRSFTPEMETELDAVLSRENDPWKALRTAIRMPFVRALRNEFPEFKTCWDLSGITAGERPVELGTSKWIAQSFGIATAQFDHFPWLTKALGADDFRRAKANGGHAGFLNTQSMTDLPRDLDLLDAAHRLGLRMLQLTYNWMNFIGAGCTERTDAGISEFGREVVARLNGLGIIIDTAHCGRQTTLAG